MEMSGPVTRRGRSRQGGSVTGAKARGGLLAPPHAVAIIAEISNMSCGLNRYPGEDPDLAKRRRRQATITAVVEATFHSFASLLTPSAPICAQGPFLLGAPGRSATPTKKSGTREFPQQRAILVRVPIPLPRVAKTAAESLGTRSPKLMGVFVCVKCHGRQDRGPPRETLFCPPSRPFSVSFLPSLIPSARCVCCSRSECVARLECDSTTIVHCDTVSANETHSCAHDVYSAPNLFSFGSV